MVQTLLDLVKNRKKLLLDAGIFSDYLEAMLDHLLGEAVEEETAQDVPLSKIEDLHDHKKKSKSQLHRTVL